MSIDRTELSRQLYDASQKLLLAHRRGFTHSYRQLITECRKLLQAGAQPEVANTNCNAYHFDCALLFWLSCGCIELVRYLFNVNYTVTISNSYQAYLAVLIFNSEHQALELCKLLHKLGYYLTFDQVNQLTQRLRMLEQENALQTLYIFWRWSNSGQ